MLVKEATGVISVGVSFILSGLWQDLLSNEICQVAEKFVDWRRG